VKLHHVGIVVGDLASHGQRYAEVLGSVATTPVIHDPLQKVYVQFWKDPCGALIELIAPASEDSPVWRDSQRGGGLNHLCYETDNIDRQIELALTQGGMLTREVSPAVAFGGRRIAFVYFLEVGLIEFVESEFVDSGSVANPT
jgi:methylmalonyl-CoA/ethylmalonyl-CoA epimerase